MATSIRRLILFDKCRFFGRNANTKLIYFDLLEQGFIRTYCVANPREKILSSDHLTTCPSILRSASLLPFADNNISFVSNIFKNNSRYVSGFPRVSFSVGLWEQKRYYCSSSDGPTQKRKKMTVFIPSPIKSIRNTLFFMLLRAYFDPEITQDDFKLGATKAFVHVTNNISEGKFDDLQGLLTETALNEVKESYGKLSVQERKLIAVGDDDVMYSIPYQVGIMYEEGKKLVQILMTFYCQSQSTGSMKSGGMKFMHIGHTPDEYIKEFGTVIKCTYEFQRDFSPDVAPEWTISFIQHGNLL